MNTSRFTLPAVLGAALILALSLAAVRPAAAQAVNSISVEYTGDDPDNNPGDGVCAAGPKNQCSLRAAIQEAGKIPTSIRVPAGRYVLTSTLTVEQGQEITLNGAGAGGTDLACDGGRLSVQGTLNIVGFDITACPTTRNDGTLWIRESSVTSHPETAINNHGGLTLNDVLFRGNGGPEVSGGALSNNAGGNVIMLGVTFDENRALSGGAINNSGTVTIGVGTFTNNQADNSGGAIRNAGEGVLSFELVRFEDNTAQMGGAIYNTSSGNSRLRQTSYTANQAPNGGAFHNSGQMHLLNATFSGNEGRDYGGAVYAGGGDLLLSNVTITDNTSLNGGGIYVQAGVVQMKHTILAQNTATATGPDCAGDLASEGYNLLGSPDKCTLSPEQGTDQVGRTNQPLDPMLEPLASDRYTDFHGLQPRSPAHDEGEPDACTDLEGNALDVDQLENPRPRPRSGSCDIGAVEVMP